MVDYIANEAKKSANQSATEEKKNEAIEFIYSNYPNYYIDNETMEKVLYYGYYLEYAYSKNGSNNLYANLGIDAYQAVKYVYRGTENVEDESTQENLRQIDEALKEIGYTNNADEEKKVWIPKNGSKYHESQTCSGMTDATEVLLSKAKEMGYSACKKCY